MHSSALKILMMIGQQYNGQNNGDLSATSSRARKWKIASDQTLAKGLKDLREKNIIFLTRTPQFLNPGGKCALYALTWNPIDECKGKLEVNATRVPLRKWSQEDWPAT